jgi:hypothetical protein
MVGAEEKWQRARLIPVTGIAGAEEQERRGTSVLLSVLSSVREFGRAITMRIGAPAGSIESFIEVEFVLGDRKVRPDGLIRVLGRGNRTWTALVEVKTGRNQLQASQVEDYLEVARAREYDAVVTVSTQLTYQHGVHPLVIDRRKTKKVALHHLSWSEIHTEALIEQLNHAVSDPDQAWILAEFIRYLEEPKSGALEFEDMGANWPAVRDAVANRTVRATDPAVSETVRRFGQLVSYAGMHLSQHLGVLVRTGVTRKDLDDPAARLQAQVGELVNSGRLTGTLVVPNAIAPFEVVADLRAGKVSCHLTVPAPKSRKTARGQVSWLTGQLHDPPADLLVQATTLHSRHSGPACGFDKVAEDPAVLLDGAKNDLRDLTLTLIRSAGAKRGRGRGCFIDSVIDLVEEFYGRVVQELKPATPSAPKVKPGKEADEGSGDAVLADLLTEAPDSEAVPSDGAGRLTDAAPDFSVPALPAQASPPS